MNKHLQTNVASIKNKFERLLKYIDTEPPVYYAAAKAMDIFTDAVKIENHIDQAYYQEDSIQLYLPDSNGICITVFSGKGDIFGSGSSHFGTDLKVYFVFDGSEDWYTLYCEDELQVYEVKRLKQKLDDLREMFDETGFSAMLSAKYGFDPYVYVTLPKEIQEDQKVIHMVLEQLWKQAESEHNDEVKYEGISPFGDSDIAVKETEEHFVKSLSYIKMDILDKAADKYLKERQAMQ